MWEGVRGCGKVCVIVSSVVREQAQMRAREAGLSTFHLFTQRPALVRTPILRNSCSSLKPSISQPRATAVSSQPALAS